MRSDIAQTVRVISKNMSNPEKEHWRAVNWILRYLKGSSDMALCYDGTDARLHGYVNSAFAGDVDSRKSNTDYVFTLGSGELGWMSRLQTVVALSTTDAEYVTTTEACK